LAIIEQQQRQNDELKSKVLELEARVNQNTPLPANPKSMNKTLLLQLLLLFLPLFATAQRAGFEMGSPIIQNYTPEEYQANGQNWAALQDQNGIMYFGNNDGVLEYDGVSWRLIPTEKKSVVRSLAIDKDNRIYVGAYGEIGYLAPDTAGQLQYISLLPFLDKKYHDFPDVWQTVTARNKIYFVTQKYIFCWANQQMRVLEGQNSLHIGMAVNDQFYVRQRDVGLMQTVADSLVLVPGGEVFADEWIFVMLPFSGRDGNGQQKDMILLGTQRRGLLLYDGQSVKPFPNEINDQLRKGQIYHGAKLPNGDYAFATIQDGVYVMDGSGQLRHHLDKKTGLQNNTAWFLYTDRQGGLWIGLDDGISRAEATAPLTQFTGSEGIEGAVLNIARHQGTLYAATSLGTYYLDENRGQPMAGAQFKRVEGISPQCFALLPVGQSLLAASYDGVFEIRGRRAKMVKKAYAFSLHRSQQDTNRVLVGLQKGILSLYHTDDGWRDEGYMENIEVEIRKILETPDNKLWLTTRYQGPMQVDLSNGFTLRPPVMQFDTLHGLPSGDMVTVFSTKKGLRFGTHHGIYEFDEKRQYFMPDTSLVRGFPVGQQQIYSVSKDEAGNLWLVTGDKSNSGLALLQRDGSYTWDEKPLMRVAGANFLFAYPDPLKEGITWLGSIGRVIQYDATVSKNYSSDFKTLIRQVIANGDSLIFGGDGTAQTGSPVELAYAFNTLRFVYGAPSFDDESKTRFQYLLEGYDEGWSKWSTESHKDYTKLPPGKYTFKVRSKNIYQHIGTTAVYDFKIRPPFYLTWWAFLFYALLLTMVFFGIRQFELKKLRKKQALKLELLEYNKLKELDQMKSRFFADITHEFRTPLTVILGINEQMANSSGQWAVSSELPTVKGKLKLVKRNSENLLRLINQLLDLAKLESNTLEINYTQGDVLPYLRYISESFHSLANAQNVLLRVESDQPAIVMDYDPERLLQIVHNLLSNAVKFTPSGGRVVLRADLAGFKNLPSLNLTISDTGVGIPPKDLPYIFDRFYQANTPPFRGPVGSKSRRNGHRSGTHQRIGGHDGRRNFRGKRGGQRDDVHGKFAHHQ
jgi:hypothetical protein